MAKRKGLFRIPDDPPGAPSWVAIIVLFAIPEFITKIIAGVLLAKRIKNEALRKRYQLYRRFANSIGNRTEVSIRELAASLGMHTGNVTSELQAMIDKGMIGGNAYIDRNHLTLHMDPSAVQTVDIGDAISQVINVFVSPEDRAQTVADARAAQAARSAQAKPEPQQQPEPQKREPAQPRKSSADSENFEAKLCEIRRLNDEIDDKEVSDRIDRIGELTASIFRVVREKPEHAEEVRKFMNYYLPTTLKLLKSYSLMEKQSYQGENIISSRKKIEDVLDTLIHAFEQQQDRLFRTEAMDVETDISVLETMMASDGLLEQRGLRMGGGSGSK